MIKNMSSTPPLPSSYFSSIIEEEKRMIEEQRRMAKEKRELAEEIRKLEDENFELFKKSIASFSSSLPPRHIPSNNFTTDACLATWFLDSFSAQKHIASSMLPYLDASRNDNGGLEAARHAIESGIAAGAYGVRAKIKRYLAYRKIDAAALKRYNASEIVTASLGSADIMLGGHFIVDVFSLTALELPTIKEAEEYFKDKPHAVIARINRNKDNKKIFFHHFNKDSKFNSDFFILPLQIVTTRKYNVSPRSSIQRLLQQKAASEDYDEYLGEIPGQVPLSEMARNLPLHPVETLSSSIVDDDTGLSSYGGLFGSAMLKMRQERGIQEPSNTVKFVPQHSSADGIGYGYWNCSYCYNFIKLDKPIKYKLWTPY
jgi:hypothetical protein